MKDVYAKFEEKKEGCEEDVSIYRKALLEFAREGNFKPVGNVLEVAAKHGEVLTSLPEKITPATRMVILKKGLNAKRPIYWAVGTPYFCQGTHFGRNSSFYWLEGLSLKSAAKKVLPKTTLSKIALGVYKKKEEEEKPVERILRITRHEASEAQLKELRRIYGDTEIKTISATLPQKSREAVNLFDKLVREHKADVVEAVLPINLLQAVLDYSTFCKEGGQIIRAQMNREVQEGGDVEFTFDHYERMVEVNILTKTL